MISSTANKVKDIVDPFFEDGNTIEMAFSWLKQGQNLPRIT